MVRQRVRRQASVLLVAWLIPVMAWTAGWVAPEPARAGVANVIAYTIDYDLADDLQTFDFLQAYVTSAYGGLVCLQRAVEPGHETGCGGPGTFAVRPIPPYFAGFVPISSGNLPAGHWMLVGTDPFDNPTARSQSFHISVCDTCIPAVIDTVDVKGPVVQSLFDSMNAICTGLDVASTLNTFKEHYQIFYAGAVGVGITGGVAVRLAVVEATAATVIGAAVPSARYNLPGFGGKMGAALWQFCTVIFGYSPIPGVDAVPGARGPLQRWLADPPDPNYAELYEPFVLPDSVMPTDPSVAAILQAADRVRSSLDGSITSYERYLGARGDGAVPATIAQADHLADQLFELTAASRDAADELDALATEMIGTTPDPADRSLTAADVNVVGAMHDRIRTSGFTPDEIAVMTAGGFDQADIDWLRGELSDPIDDAPVGVPLDALFRDLAEQLREAAPIWEDVGIQALNLAEQLRGPAATAPIAAFTAVPTGGEAPLTVQFDASGTTDADDDPLTFAWSFGDGTTGIGVDPGHTYPAAGTYTVTLTVSDGDASDTATQAVTVTGNRAPVAARDVRTTFTSTPVNVAVLANDSDPDGDALAVTSWTQGSGGSVDCSPTACTYTPGAVVGTDIFRYTIGDGRGGEATASVAVTILPSFNPTAAGTVGPTTGPAPLTVTVDGSISSDPGGSIVDWQWDFGDDSTGAGVSDQHTYQDPGAYIVTLAVTDDDGNSSTGFVAQVIVEDGTNALPVVFVSGFPTSGPAPLTVDLTSFGSQDPDGAIATFAWDFGDGSSASGPPATHGALQHTFTTPGTYTVTLTGTDGDGGSATAELAVNVYPPANQPPSVTGESASTFKGETIQVDVLGNDADPDGGTLSITGVQGPFAGTGACDPGGLCTYTPSRGYLGSDSMTYTVSDGQGGVAFGQLATSVVRAPGAPIAVPTVTPSVGVTPLSTTFDGTGSTDAGGDVVAYAWTIDDVPISDEATFEHVFVSGGRFTIGLTVTDDDGLTDEVLATVDVRGIDELSLPYCGDQEDGTEVTDCLEYELDPSVQFYRVSGTGPVTLTFDYIVRLAGFGNELVLFRVDDGLGAIDGISPGETGYPDRVLERARAVFPSGSTASAPDAEIDVRGGEIYGFFILPFTTLDEARAQPGWEQSAFFSLDALNTDDTDHFVAFRHLTEPISEFAWEDLAFGGDRDYDDIVFTVTGALAPVAQVAVTKVVDEPSALAGDTVGYTITVTNSTDSDVPLGAILDTLPAGFAYVDGSTDGATTADPVADDQSLRWDVDVTIPASDAVSLSFDAITSSTPGPYDNEAFADAGDIPVSPTGPTARVIVVPALPVDPPALVDAGPDRIGGVASAIGLDGTVIDPLGDPPSVWTYEPGPLVDPGASCAFADDEQVDTTISCTDAGEYSVTLTADDDGTPVADSASVTILPTGSDDQPPQLAEIPDQVVDEGATVALIADAEDPDGDAVGYSLSNCPLDATIDSDTGAFSWSTTEADGPADEMCSVVVAANGLTAEQIFAITVLEINEPPALEPLSDITVPAGGTALHQAEATDPDIPANRLSFALVGSPGGIDDATGAFSWLTGPGDVGDHTVTVRVEDGADGSDTGTFVVHVTGPTPLETELDIGGDTGGQYTDVASISARLTAADAPIAGAAISLTFGAQTKSATTDIDGVATATFTIPGPAGPMPTAASYAGDAGHTGSSATGSFTVVQEDASLDLPGGGAIEAGSSVTLRADVRDSASAGYLGAGPEPPGTATFGAITNMRVAFEVYNAGSCQTGAPVQMFLAVVVDDPPVGDGIGSATAEWPSVVEGSYCVSARLIGSTPSAVNDWYVAPPPMPIGFGVFKPAAGHVTGGGWVPLADGPHLNFGFNAKSDGKKGVKGQLNAVARADCASEPSRLHLKAYTIQSLQRDGRSGPATIILSGKATIRCTAEDDGATLFESGNAMWQATVVDGGKRPDAFGITVVDKSGRRVLDVTPTTLGGGSIVAHLK
jgi:uncharacterized repeat protein (TIGR01451 family)